MLGSLHHYRPRRTLRPTEGRCHKQHAGNQRPTIERPGSHLPHFTFSRAPVCEWRSRLVATTPTLVAAAPDVVSLCIHHAPAKHPARRPTSGSPHQHPDVRQLLIVRDFMQIGTGTAAHSRSLPQSVPIGRKRTKEMLFSTACVGGVVLRGHD